ncbi:MAG TPA: MAPEG family protein [Casimicrobiaceae bacterium]|nr:MAPEG family protein [Casimicrobiaceae bacterium]
MSPAPMPFVTALYAGIFALILLALGLKVSRRRRQAGIGLGAGGDAQLERTIRVHGNAVEWGLAVLLLMLIAEENRASHLLLHVCGIVFVVARVIHAAGLSRRSGHSTGRVAGAVLTYIVLAVLAVWNIVAFVRPLLA